MKISLVSCRRSLVLAIGITSLGLLSQADGRESSYQPKLASDQQKSSASFVSERFARTELYFGTARPDGLPPVSDEQFQKFLDTVITPAFPDGLTLLKGLGQFRGASGVAIEEDSFVVILLYPAEARRDSSRRIEEIRASYKDQFEQESVLRSDRCCESVGF